MVVASSPHTMSAQLLKILTPWIIFSKTGGWIQHVLGSRKKQIINTNTQPSCVDLHFLQKLDENKNSMLKTEKQIWH